MYAIKIMFMSGPDDGLECWLKSNQNMGHAIQDGWEFKLGRGEDSDLKIPYDTQVSRSHVLLRIKGDVLEIEDAKSRNGTFFKNQAIATPTTIAPGEIFRIGYTWLRIQEVTR